MSSYLYIKAHPKCLALFLFVRSGLETSHRLRQLWNSPLLTVFLTVLWRLDSLFSKFCDEIAFLSLGEQSLIY